MVLGKMGLFALISRPKSSTQPSGRQEKHSQPWRQQEQRSTSERTQAVDVPSPTAASVGKVPSPDVPVATTALLLLSPAVSFVPPADLVEGVKQDQVSPLASGPFKPRAMTVDLTDERTVVVSDVIISPRGDPREEKEVGASAGGSGSLSCSTMEREDGPRGCVSLGDASSQQRGELYGLSQGGASSRLRLPWGRGGLRRNTSSSAGIGSVLGSGGGGSGKFSASARSEDLSPSAVSAMVYANAPVDSSPGRDTGNSPPDHLSDPGVYFKGSFRKGAVMGGDGSVSSRNERGQETDDQARHLSGSEFCGLSEGQVRWADRVPIERSRSDMALHVRGGRSSEVTLFREEDEDADAVSTALSGPDGGSRQGGEGRSARSAPLHWTIGAEDEDEGGDDDERPVVARSEPAPDNPDSPSGGSQERDGQQRRLESEPRRPSSSRDVGEDDERDADFGGGRDGRRSGSEIESDSPTREGQAVVDDVALSVVLDEPAELRLQQEGSLSHQDASPAGPTNAIEEQGQRLEHEEGIPLVNQQIEREVGKPHPSVVFRKAAPSLPLIPGGGSMARVQEWVTQVALEGPFPPEDLDREAYLEPPSPPAVPGQEGGFVGPLVPHSGGSELAGLPGALDADMAAAARCLAGLSRASAAMHLAARGLKVVPPVASFGALKILHLAHNAIARIPAGSLPRSLHLLDLSHNRLSAIEGMRELTRLRVLNLSHNRLTRIGHGLSSCSSLRELYLSNNKIGEVEGLHRLLKLAVFDVAHNKLTSTKALGQLAANYGSMQALNLSGNPIYANLGEDGCKRYICGLLPQLSYLNNSPLKPLSAREVASDTVARGSHSSSIPRGSSTGSKPSVSRTVSRSDRSSSASRSKAAQPASSSSTNRHRRNHSSSGNSATAAGTNSSNSAARRRSGVPSSSSAQHYVRSSADMRNSADVAHVVRSGAAPSSAPAPALGPPLVLDTSHLMLAVQEVGGEGDGAPRGGMSRTPDLRMGHLSGSFNSRSAIATSVVAAKAG
eukprot:TRINITY_DN22168_c0_g1_i1.p1 TRINITY_DN22168_c0_g1~~TRINITY_DN22168_c0_g1_i1.p1  ORF type:complete len:1012 (+),score=170.07 TRINITY_DN22168_c0_g1_i1:384-3419(+)